MTEGWLAHIRQCIGINEVAYTWEATLIGCMTHLFSVFNVAKKKPMLFSACYLQQKQDLVYFSKN